MGVRVATASETAACEQAAMDRGVTAARLMKLAGDGAATSMLEEYGDLTHAGVVVFAGTGNNGGDGWVVAESLATRGIDCRVVSLGDPRSTQARDARDAALASGVCEVQQGNMHERLVVDALLGTGSTGAPHGSVASSISAIRTLRENGARVVALDLPSGLDATTGANAGSVSADMTISFGTIKRGHLVARDVCGTIAVVDIGLTENDLAGLPLLVDDAWVAARVPRIPSAAHKGTRKSLAVIGGARGMAGAAILAGEGALRSGIGLLRISTEAGNETAVFAGIPAAIVQPWPFSAGDIENFVATPDAIAIGPGLGSSPRTRDLVERILIAWSGPVVVDADALNVFAGDVLSLARLLGGRPVVITPHPAEFARLAGLSTEAVVSDRFDVGLELAAQLGATVLLKGSPTVVFGPSGERYVSATGTPALATGGSGDVLTGMIGTLLAQMCGDDSVSAPAEAAACAAFVHGRAAELCRFVRGTTLADVLAAMPEAWSLRAGRPEGRVIGRLESPS